MSCSLPCRRPVITDATSTALHAALDRAAAAPAGHRRQHRQHQDARLPRRPGRLRVAPARRDLPAARRPSVAGGTVARSLEPTNTNGNNVNLDTETLIATETGLRYQLALTRSTASTPAPHRAQDELTMAIFDTLGIAGSGADRPPQVAGRRLGQHRQHQHGHAPRARSAFQARMIVAAGRRVRLRRGRRPRRPAPSSAAPRAAWSTSRTTRWPTPTGYVRYPDIDLGDQMTQLIMAQRGYQANLAVVDRATERLPGRPAAREGLTMTLPDRRHPSARRHRRDHRRRRHARHRRRAGASALRRRRLRRRSWHRPVDKLQRRPGATPTPWPQAATGDLKDVHDYMIASTEASLATEHGRDHPEQGRRGLQRDHEDAGLMHAALAGTLERATLHVLPRSASGRRSSSACCSPGWSSAASSSPAGHRAHARRRCSPTWPPPTPRRSSTSSTPTGVAYELADGGQTIMVPRTRSTTCA